MSLTSSIYRMMADIRELSPMEAARRNAALRRDIAHGTGWAVIDLDAVPGWLERKIIARESARQNQITRRAT